MRTLGKLATAVLVSSFALPTLAGATTINYQGVGDFAGTSFSINGLTATAENGGSLGISFTGLGVVGGLDPGRVLIDTTESVRFTFDSGGATGVAFGYSAGTSNSAANRVWNIEGFDLQGASLGLATFDIIDAVGVTPINVSARFGNVALSAFRLFGNGGNSGGSLARVAFTDAPPPPAVPEPTTLLLCTTGLAFAGYRRRRMTRN